MTDKILKEAYDKLVSIEENDTGRWDDDFNYDEDEMRGIDHYSEEPKTKYKTDNIYADPKDEPVKEGRAEDEDGIDVLEEIQGRLFEVIDDLTDAIRGYHPSQLSYWQSYGLAQLKIVAGSDEYATHDKSINSLIEEIREKLAGEPDDYEDDGMDDPAGEDSVGESEETDRMRKDLDTIRQRTNTPAEEPRRRTRPSRRRGTGAADQSMRQR